MTDKGEQVSLGVVRDDASTVSINSYGGRPAPVASSKPSIGDSMGPRPAPPQPPKGK